MASILSKMENFKFKRLFRILSKWKK